MLRPAFWQFDETFPGNALPAAQKLSLLLYDTGKIYLRAGQEAREAAAARLGPEREAVAVAASGGEILG